MSMSAVASHRCAVALVPDNADALYNLSLALRDTGQLDEALDYFAQTLAISPDHPGCHFDRALTLLQNGDIKDGLEEYEWRWKLNGNAQRDFSQPQWDGADLGDWGINISGLLGILAVYPFYFTTARS